MNSDAVVKVYRKLCIQIVSIGIGTGVYAENLFEQIGWKGATSSIIQWLVIVFIFGIVLLTGLYVRSQLVANKLREKVSDDLFDELCVKADLFPNEKEKLLNILKHEYIQLRHSIFQSASLYERCVDAEIKILLLTGKSEEEIERTDQILSSLRKKMGYGYLPLEHPLLSTRNLEIGQSVSVFPLTGQTPLINHAVVVANKETHFRISCKQEKVNTVAIQTGKEVKIAFARQGDAVYGLTSEVVAIHDDVAMDCLHTLKFQRNQLRQFVRMEVNLPLKVRKLSADKSGVSEPFMRQIDVKLTDISGGGLSFVYTEPLGTGDQVSLQFTLTTGKFTGVRGKVLRVSNVENQEKPMYRHHVQFVAIETHLRDKIIRFIFDKQRSQNQIR